MRMFMIIMAVSAVLGVAAVVAGVVFLALHWPR